jgi:hypothetical protein
MRATADLDVDVLAPQPGEIDVNDVGVAGLWHATAGDQEGGRGRAVAEGRGTGSPVRSYGSLGPVKGSPAGPRDGIGGSRSWPATFRSAGC